MDFVIGTQNRCVLTASLLPSVTGAKQALRDYRLRRLRPPRLPGLPGEVPNPSLLLPWDPPRALLLPWDPPRAEPAEANEGIAVNVRTAGVT